MKTIVALLSFLFIFCNGNSQSIQNKKTYQLITLDPGHFHAALVQKSMYGNVDSVVQVYSKAGTDLDLHLKRISDYNNRKENPTKWKEEVYTGDDFFEKMIQQKKGNIVVLSGNNENKSDYIFEALQNGLNVLADKPMAINHQGFDKIKSSFALAAKKKLLLYDIMTERFEITTILQREISMMPEIFGTLEAGTMENPSVVKESVHYLYKYVSGNVLTRPVWFLDVSKQGEGIADVMTHLVDLVQWECFPNQVIDYKKDIQIHAARHWATIISFDEFKTITHSEGFPAYLSKNIIQDSSLQYFCNGEINYQLKNIHAKTIALWKYKAPEGTGDTYYSLLKGTKATLIIQQGEAEKYRPKLYIKPCQSGEPYKTEVETAFKKIEQQFPGITLKEAADGGWQVVIPEKYAENHEEHFGRVVNNYLNYLQNKNIPIWEVPNMLAKYYTTTKALDIAQQNK